MASEQEREKAREKFAVVVTFMILLPLLLIGFFFIVLGLKLEVLDWQAVIVIDALMTFGYVILWFVLKGYLLKYFLSAKGRPVQLSEKVRVKRPEVRKPSVKQEKKESKLLKKILKKEEKAEEKLKKRERWQN